MNISIYNIETGFIEELEIKNSLEEIEKVYKNIPVVPGCFLTLNKGILGLKLQVVNTVLYRYIFYYKKEKKSILADKSEGIKAIKILLEDELEFVRLFDFPEKYMAVKKVEQPNSDNSVKKVEMVSIANAYKTYKGKEYTQEEWKKFEQKQFEEYARKNNIPIEKDTFQKGGSFFLDEKESDY